MLFSHTHFFFFFFWHDIERWREGEGRDRGVLSIDPSIPAALSLGRDRRASSGFEASGSAIGGYFDLDLEFDEKRIKAEGESEFREWIDYLFKKKRLRSQDRRRYQKRGARYLLHAAYSAS